MYLEGERDYIYLYNYLPVKNKHSNAFICHMSVLNIVLFKI